MTEISNLSAALSKVIGARGSGAEGYDELFEDAGLEIPDLETVENQADLADLSDIELQEIALKLSEYVKNLEDLEKSREINDIIKAINAYITQDGEISEDEDDDVDDNKYKDAAELALEISQDVDGDGDIDDRQLKGKIKNEVPAGFATLDVDEQLAILELYKDDDEKFADAIVLLSPVAIADLLAEASDNSALFGKIFSEISTNDTQTVLNALIGNNSIIQQEPDKAEDIVNKLLSEVDDGSENSNSDLEKQFFDAVQQNDNLFERLHLKFHNAQYSNNTGAQNKIYWSDGSKSSAKPTSFDDIKELIADNLTPSDEVEGIVDNIVQQLISEDAADNIISFSEQDDIDSQFDEHLKKAANQGMLPDVMDALVKQLGNAKPEFLQNFVGWIATLNQYYATNKLNIQYQDIHKTFIKSLQKNPETSLYLNKEINPGEQYFISDFTLPNQLEVDDIVNRLTDNNEGNDDLGGNFKIIDLGYAFPQISDPEDQTKIIEEIFSRVKSNSDGVSDQEKIQELLLVFNNVPELRDAIDNILEKNPDHEWANLLSFEGGDVSDLSGIVDELKDTFKTAGIDEVSAFIVDAVDDRFDDLATDDIGRFEQLADKLPLRDADGDEIDPADSIETFFEEYKGSKDEIFQALADGNSELYKRLDGDVTDIMTHFWRYLQQSETDQKDFLAQIPAYSPVHISLLEKVQELKEDGDTSNYADELADLAEAIANQDSSFGDVDLSRIFPDDDDSDPSISEIVYDIFGNVSDIYRDEATSDNLGEFIALFANDNVDKDDIVAFLNDLTHREFSEFTSALTNDNSAIFTLLGQDDGSENLDNMMQALIEALTDDNIEEGLAREFLMNIDSSSLFYDEIMNIGALDISDAIDDEDFSEISDERIQEFIAHDLSDVTKLWYNSKPASDYLDDLSGTSSKKEIRQILEKAEEEGLLESVLFLVASDRFDDGSEEFYYNFFDFLDSDSGKKAADIFMQNIDPQSNLGRTLTKLADADEKPFDNITYSINKETGKLDFGNDAEDIINVIQNSSRGKQGLAIFTETFDKIKTYYENTTGADNYDLAKIIEEAQNESLNNGFFDEIFEIDNLDTDKAEDIIQLILDNDSIIYKDLQGDKLEHFLNKFVNWIETEDTILDIFEDELTKGSNFYRALVTAGADPDDYDDMSEFIRGAKDFDDAAFYIEQSIRFKKDGDQSLDFITEMLRGTSGNNEIKDAIDDIVRYASADSDVMEEIIFEIITEGPIISSLTSAQTEAFLTETFDIIINQDSGPSDELSDLQDEFLGGLSTISSGTINYIIHSQYPILADYAGISTMSQDIDYDDKDVKNELKKLLQNNDFIQAYAKRSNGSNEIQTAHYNAPNYNAPNYNANTTFYEDDIGGSNSASYNSTNVNANAQAGIISQTDTSSEVNSDNFATATDAAIATLGKFTNAAGEPDFETGIFSTYFLEENSIEKIADIAAKNNFDTRSVIGTLQMIPLEGQIDFIREMLANRSLSADVKDFLLGRLLIMLSEGKVGQRTLDAILDDAGIDELTINIAEDILNSWSDSLDRYTKVSITAIDNTYENVFNKLSSTLPKDADYDNNSVTANNNPQESMNDLYMNYQMAMMNGGMMQMPFGYNMGMGMGMGMNPMSGMGSFGIDPLFGMGSMGMGMNPMSGMGAFNSNPLNMMGGMAPYGANPYGANPYASMNMGMMMPNILPPPQVGYNGGHTGGIYVPKLGA